VTNSGTVAASVTVTDVLPLGLTYVFDSLEHVSPAITLTASFSGNQLVAHTEGAALGPAARVTISFAAEVGDPPPAGWYLANGIELQDQERTYVIPPSLIATRHLIWLPVVAREH